ncbi:hypothetical protein [Streptomyces spinosirectus]
MSDTPMPGVPGTSTRQYVATIADHLTRPLPTPGFHLLKLHESRDFSSGDPDDDWAELQRVSAEFEAELRDLATALDARWGPHGEMSMEPYAFLDPDEDEGDDEDDDVPPLLRELVRQGWFGDLLHWHTADRVIVASVGHEDKEEPLVLFAAVATDAALTGPACGSP